MKRGTGVVDAYVQVVKGVDIVVCANERVVRANVRSVPRNDGHVFGEDRIARSAPGSSPLRFRA